MDIAEQAVQLEGAAFVWIDNPPVNVMSAEVRKRLLADIRRAAADPATKVVVVLAKGKTFVSGADLNEFDGEIAEPGYRTVLEAIETCAKPVIAVLHGTVFGAGVELALACHYRVALKGTRIGLPEITLGLVPGAGATQRLPRIVGMDAALDMLLSGAPLSAEQAQACGLVDGVGEGDPQELGGAFAARVLADGLPPRPTRGIPADELADETVAAALRKHARALRGRTTQFMMIEALRAARNDIEQGLDIEAELSAQSMKSRESEALRHMFFAERKASVIPGLPAGIKPRAIAKVAVVGAGTMGSGIAMAFANAGFAVTLVDAKEEGLERGRGLIETAYRGDARRGRITPDQAEKAIAAIGTTLQLADAADADLVVEAVFENLDLKKGVLAQIDATVAPEAIIATNTSSLSVTELGRATGRPDKVLGLHFFSPAHIMKLLEIVRGDDTSLETLATGIKVAAAIRKVPVVSGDGFGFIGNRMMLDGAFREGEQMLLEGAGVAQVDDAVEAFGFAMGPSRVNDMAGVDIGTLVREQLALREARRDPYCVVSDALTPMGRIGQKVGKGFYSYAVDPRKGEIDPEVTALIRRLADERGIVARPFTDEEIVERFVLQLINVGADILDQGIAYRAADIDVVWVHGFGFPRHLGGPMFHADTLGLAHVLERVEHWHERLGHYWRPSRLLKELAAAGSSFAAYDRERVG